MAVMVAGCGRWGFDPAASDGGTAVDGSAVDGSAPDAAQIDGTAGEDALSPACTSGTFGNVELVTGLGLSPDLYGVSPTADGSAIYFSQVSTGPRSEELYLAARIAGSQFQAAQPVTELNTSVQDGTPFISVDGLELLFSSERSGSDGRDLWLANRANSADPLAVDRWLAELSSPETDHTPSLTGDGRTLFFGSDRDSPGRENIYRATRVDPGATFGPVTLVSELSSATNYDTSPFVSPDGLTIYFMSDRPGGTGCDDIWMAERASTGDPFGMPVPVAGVNSTGCEDDPALSADGCELWFASDRDGGYQLYRATR